MVGRPDARAAGTGARLRTDLPHTADRVMSRNRIQIALLLAILVLCGLMFIAAVGRIRETANRSKCRNNFRQICIGWENYRGANNDRYPRAILGSTEVAP